MAFVVPPVVKQSERLLLEIERAVMKFGRFHKYSYGTTLRDSAMQVAKLSHRVWRDRAHQAERISELVWAVDDLKLSLFALPLRGKISTYGETFSWHDAPSGWQARADVHGLAADEAALCESEGSSLRAVWRTWHQGLLPLARIVRELPRRHGRASGRHNAGSSEQRWSLRAGELPLGGAQDELTQPFGQPAAHFQRADKNAGRMGRIHRPQPCDLAGTGAHGLDGRADSDHAFPLPSIQSRADHQGREQAAGRLVPGTRHQPAHGAAPPLQARHDASR